MGKVLRINTGLIQRCWRASFKYTLSEQLFPLQKQWDIADAERRKKDLQLVFKQHVSVINEINAEIKKHNTARSWDKKPLAEYNKKSELKVLVVIISEDVKLEMLKIDLRMR